MFTQNCCIIWLTICTWPSHLHKMTKGSSKTIATRAHMPGSGRGLALSLLRQDDQWSTSAIYKPWLVARAFGYTPSCYSSWDCAYTCQAGCWLSSGSNLGNCRAFPHTPSKVLLPCSITPAYDHIQTLMFMTSMFLQSKRERQVI